MKQSKCGLLFILVFGCAIVSQAAPAPSELALASRLFEEGRYELVLNALEPVMGMDLAAVHASRALYLRAESRYQLGQRVDAKGDFLRLEREHSESRWIEPVLARLASMAVDAGEGDQAALYIDELKDRFPDSAQLSTVMLDFGLHQLESGDYAGVADTLGEWLGRYAGSSGTSAARLALARANVALGRYEPAAGVCREMLASASPEFASEASALLVESLYSGRRFEDLAREGGDLIRGVTDPENALRAEMLYSIALVRTRQAADGMARLEQLLDEPSAQDVDRRILVDAYVALGGAILAASPEPDPSRVYAAYESAESMLAGASEEEVLLAVLNRKGMAAWTLGDATTAATCFEVVAAASDSSLFVSGVLNLGWVLRSLGRFDQAAEVYGRAVAQEPPPAAWEWAALGKAESAYAVSSWDECRSCLTGIPASVGEFSPRPDNTIHAEESIEVVRRAAWLRGSAVLEIGDLAKAGEAFGALLQMAVEGTYHRTLALLGLAEVASRGGNPGRAALLYEQALAGEGVGAPPEPGTSIAASRRRAVEKALFGLARARQELRELEAGLALFEAALALFPDGPYATESLFREAEILESLGRLEAAKEAYVILGKRQPVEEFVLESARRAALIDAGLGRWSDAEKGLAALLEAIGEVDAATVRSGTEVFEEAVRYDLGDLYLRLGRNTEAQEQFARNRERFAEGPGVDRNLLGLGQAQYNDGNFQGAAATYGELITRSGASPLVPQALLWLGWSYQNLGLNEKATEVWGRLEREFPESKSAPLAAAAWAQQVESASPAKAAAFWSRLAETYRARPIAPAAQFRAGLLALETVQPATAVRYFRRYREMFPEADRVLESHVWEGMAHQISGAPAEAREAFGTYFNQAGEAGKDPALRAKAVTGYAQALWDLGDPHGAATFLQEELAKPGTDTALFRDAHVLLGDVLVDAGRPREAIPVYRRVISLARGDRVEARVGLRLAECLEAIEDSQAAVMEYVKVVYLYESEPDLATVGMIRAADLFEKLGDHREAIRSYRRALELSPTSEQKAMIEERVAWLEEHLGLLELELPRGR